MRSFRILSLFLLLFPFASLKATRIGGRILPEWFSLEDNPTIDSINGVPLVGDYRFDEEGVSAERIARI